MGVSRLWTFLNQNLNKVMTVVDLVKEAKKKQPDKLKIVVDFYSWEHLMLTHFMEALRAFTQNEDVILCGGEYKILDNFIRSFIEQLRNVNIELVFFIDGAQGSAPVSSSQKMKTWRERHNSCEETLRKTMDYFNGKRPRCEVDKVILPCLQDLQSAWTVKECGCAVYAVVSGEADDAIARYLLEDKDVFCVLSNDTDFCIFPNCSYIHDDFLDLDQDLGFGDYRLLTFKQPTKLLCGVIEAKKVMELLDLPNFEALTEFALIAGNDFTSPFYRDVPAFRQEFWGQMDKLADLIRRYKVAERCELFKSLIEENPALRTAVLHSRHFYNLTLENEEKEGDHIFNIIVGGIKSGTIPSAIMSIHRGNYWHKLVLENPWSGLPSADHALATLRSYTYAILLPANAAYVTEVGWTRNSFLGKVLVRKSDDPRVPSLDKIVKNSFEENLQIFQHIIQHQETQPTEVRDYFHMFGLRIGFLCYLLQYFLLQNWQQNLFLSKLEFYVVVAWTLFKQDHSSNESSFQMMKIVPSPRCVTMENWFLVLYRGAYAHLGKILGLSHEFPPPCELFSGTLWVALYTACAVFDPHSRNPEQPPLSVPQEELKKAYDYVKKVVVDHRDIVVNVVRGLFQVE